MLDIGVSGNAGSLVFERLKQNAHVHVISVSDYTNKGMFMGAVGYILDPVKREQLVQAFQKLETRSLPPKLQRVLIVEDNEVQLGQPCSACSASTAGARTIAECLDQLKSTIFDCIVFDLTLSMFLAFRCSKSFRSTKTTRSSS